MSVDIRNTFEGRLNLVSMSVRRLVVGGGPLEVSFSRVSGMGFLMLCLYIVLSVTLRCALFAAFASALWRC